MNRHFFAFVFILLSSQAFASTIQVSTGYGYIVDGVGNVISKSELPIGKHDLKEGYSYVELNNKAELDAIQVYVPPPTQEESDRAKEAELQAIDFKSIRALRAVIAAEKDGVEPGVADVDTLKALEEQAKSIRNRK